MISLNEDDYLLETYCRHILLPVLCNGRSIGYVKYLQKYKPFVWLKYKRNCKAGLMKLGKIMHCVEKKRSFILIPIGIDSPSITDEYIISGLMKVKEYREAMGVESLAMPLLGGNIDVPEEELFATIYNIFKDTDLRIEVYKK